jgi:hypothetical protein
LDDDITYDVIMANVDKRFGKMRSNPKDWRIEDLQAIADSCGIMYKSTGGSHVVFRCVPYAHVTVPAQRPIKPIYIKQFITLVDMVKEEETNENDAEESV